MVPTLLAIILVGMLSMRLLPGSNAQEFSSRGEGDWLDDCFETVGLHDTLIGGYVRYVYQLATKLDFGGRMGGQPLGQYIL